MVMELSATSMGRSCILLTLWLHQYILTSTMADKSVFFDHYGDCQRQEPFDLSDDEYQLKHKGGPFVHENLVCNISFRAPSRYGVCLKFEELDIEDCRVRINLYRMTGKKENLWSTFDCNLDATPGQMCTPERMVKIQVLKSTLIGNKGYKFEIEVEKSNIMTDESVLIASIGVFVGIILGVVFIIALLGFVIIYCCCKHRKKRKAKDDQQTESQSFVQPSAPPLESQDNRSHLYPQLGATMAQDMPPPYIMADAPPPPYEPTNNQEIIQQMHSVEDEETLPLKQ